jgi:PAS domain S-box-containing protein
MTAKISGSDCGGRIVLGINKDKNISTVAELRRRAEELLPLKASEVGLSRTNCEMQRSHHELEVYRIELELQNTELFQARDDAEHSLEKYTDLYDFAPVGYFNLDRFGSISSVNLRGASLVGVARSRLLGLRFGQLVADEFRNVFNDFLGNIFSNQDKTACEVVLQNKENRPVIVLLEAMAAISGQECGLVLIDITARKQAEESLIKSEERYHRITEGLTDYLYTVRIENGQAVETTQSLACKIVTGYSPEEFIADPYLWIQIVTPEDRDMVKDRVHLLLQGMDIPAIEHRIIRKDGVVRWVRDTTILFKDATGNLESFDGVIQDITVRKLAEEKLHKYARRLVEMEEELRNRIAAELHDEICRDLTAVGINMAIISDGMKNVAPKRLTARAKDSGKMIKNISRTVRNIMNGLRPPVLDDYGLLATLRWHADLFSKRNNIEVIIESDEYFPRLAEEKETALFRISQEALMNVLKHATARIVTIKLSSAGGLIRFAVVDDGKGFVPEAPLNNQTDSGWGMNIMRKRAQLIGGFFHVDSAPGKGATVSVVLSQEDV